MIGQHVFESGFIRSNSFYALQLLFVSCYLRADLRQKITQGTIGRILECCCIFFVFFLRQTVWYYHVWDSLV